MEEFKFVKSTKKVERTHNVTGKVISAVDYKTPKGDIPGVAVQLQTSEGIFNFRLLKGMLKGAHNAASLTRCDVELLGTLREYEGRNQFQPRECVVTKQSVIAQLATTGTAFAGVLD